MPAADASKPQGIRLCNRGELAGTTLQGAQVRDSVPQWSERSGDRASSPQESSHRRARTPSLMGPMSEAPHVDGPTARVLAPPPPVGPVVNRQNREGRVE